MSATDRPYSLPSPHDNLHDRAMLQPMRHECLRCGNDFQGTAAACIDWFRLHRCICKPVVQH